MNFLSNTNQNTITNNKNTIMQQTQTTNKPTPQNISKWSLGRKEIRAKNEFLMNQLDSKNLIISKMKKEINELNFKVKLNGMEIPQSISDSKKVYFEYELKNSDDESLTYRVYNNELDFNDEFEVYYCDIIEHFKDSEIDDMDLKEFIKDKITDSLYF